jgi:hypothetical protein
MKYFNHAGNESVIIKFPCTFCDNPRIISPEIPILYPDILSGNKSNSFKINEEELECDHCNHIYLIKLHASWDKAFIEVEEVEGEDISIEEIPDHLGLNYFDQQVEGTNKHKIYQNFVATIINLEKLNNIDIDKELKSILNAQVYIAAVTTLETFLSDMFINLTLNDEEYLKNFIKTFPEFKNTQVGLNTVFDHYENRSTIARTAMYKIIYHNLRIVREMYRNTFNIEFPDIGKISKCINIRHDLVHRSGKTQTGDSIGLNKAMVSDTLNDIRDFVFELATKLNVQTYFPGLNNLQDIGDDLPF